MIRLLNVYYPTKTVVLLLSEALLVSGCFFLATFILQGFDTYIALFYEFGLLKIGVITLITIALSYYFDLYEPQIVSTPVEIYFRLLLVLGCDCFLMSAVLFFFPEMEIGNGIYALGFVFLAPGLILWRKAYDWIVNHKFFRERVYVLGSGEQARSIVDAIRSRNDVGMEVVAWHDIHLDGDSEKQHRKQAWIDDLNTLANTRNGVHRVIVALEDARGELPVQELLGLRFAGVTIETVGTVRERLSGKIQLDGLRPSNFLYSEGFRIRPSQQFTRRCVSFLAAATGLLLFLPFFPIVVLLVRFTSKGPIFFRQTRTGVGGRPFQVIKFRTMFTDAEAAGAKWATKDDPRVTSFGMFMRKTRIDEIPQLWNVLKGDMGFVGPRPERPEFIPWLAEELPFYYLRNLIRPGLTGWAQIRYGYGATLAETREKLEYDLYYIKHMSLGLDLLIMFETIKTIIRRRGAQ
jgi:sugar transferase (PEP-CTERM system associated)